MKKCLIMFAVGVFTIGLTSCEPESIAENEAGDLPAMSPDKNKSQCTGCDDD